MLRLIVLMADQSIETPGICRPDKSSAGQAMAAASSGSDELVTEEPLEIRVRGRAISVTMRTPGHDEELAAGFLLTEGVIGGAGDVVQISACEKNEEGNVVNVLLAGEVPVDFDRLTRHVFASSSCGLCGKATIESVSQQFRPVKSDVVMRAELIASHCRG